MNALILRTQRGVTLIELLVAVVILGIVAGLALPSFQTFIQNGAIRASAESIQNGLQLARAEALRRNVRVRFVLTNGAVWTVSEDSTGTQIQARSGGESAATVTATPTPANATTVTFNSLGRRVTNTDGSAQLDKVVLDISASTRDMQVEIQQGGQIRLCDPSITTAGDVRKCQQ